MTARIAHSLTEAELDAAQWAACGPAACAALLGRPLAEIRHAFPRQTEKAVWCNLAMMGRALATLGVMHSHTPAAMSLEHEHAKAWPRHGLVIVQWRGSWDRFDVNHPAQLAHSHWIAVAAPGAELVGDGRMRVAHVFDVNLVGLGNAPGGWCTREAWERRVAPELARESGRSATGAWWVRAGLEVLDCEGKQGA